MSGLDEPLCCERSGACPIAPWEGSSVRRIEAEGGHACPSNLCRDRARRPSQWTVDSTARSVASQGSIRASFRRPRAGDRGLIAAPWTPLASLCLPFRIQKRSNSRIIIIICKNILQF